MQRIAMIVESDRSDQAAAQAKIDQAAPHLAKKAKEICRIALASGLDRELIADEDEDENEDDDARSELVASSSALRDTPSRRGPSTVRASQMASLGGCLFEFDCAGISYNLFFTAISGRTIEMTLFTPEPGIDSHVLLGLPLELGDVLGHFSYRAIGGKVFVRQLEPERLEELDRVMTYLLQDEDSNVHQLR